MSGYHTKTRYQASLVSIKDHSCRPTTLGCGKELQMNGHEMLFPRAGVFVKHTGREQIVADPNHVLFFKDGDVYRASHPNCEGDDFTTFIFSTGTLIEILSLYEPAAQDRQQMPFRISHCQVTPQLQFEHHRLRQLLNNPLTDPLQIEELAMDLFHKIASSSFKERGITPPKRREATVSARRELVETVKLLLASNPETNFSLQKIAGSVYSSPFHLARLFREEVGLTIHQYQIRLRLILSLNSLAEQPASLTDLAFELGFSSHSHFTFAFRKTFGIAPSVFSQTATTSQLSEMSNILTA